MKREEFISIRNRIEDGHGTKEDYMLLEPYKVDNAIIMAAGYSARCLPLSNIIPKGLFRIKGEILIEREIKQLIESNVKNIIVVTGFMHEKFEYLSSKYNVKIIYNEDYDKYNNISSLYAAKEYMLNSYILCSDNYYEDNHFHEYVFESYYSCVYSDEYCDEYCVEEVDENGIIKKIKRGGKKAWYTIGDAFFNKNFSKIFVELMENEWDYPKTRGMLMDDFHALHIDVLPLKKVERESRRVLEFDTIAEIKEFDKSFQSFIDENIDKNSEVNKIFLKYSNVKAYHSVPTEGYDGRLHLNENLFGPSPKCLEILKEITSNDLCYYDLGYEDELLKILVDKTGVSGNNIFIHNGSSEVIKSICSILLKENDVILVPDPGWSYYKSIADVKFSKVVKYEVRECEQEYVYNVEDLINKYEEHIPKVIVITFPHMPTGCSISYTDVEKVVATCKNSVILLDEAYWGFDDISNEFEKRMITQYSNVVITRTFSKFYALADIRIGYGLCSYPLRRTIGLDLPLFRACGISRKIARAALEDEKYYNEIRRKIIDIREWFIDELNKMVGVTAFKSISNFVYLKIKNVNIDIVSAYMEENGLKVRLFTENEELRLRITIGSKEIMERVLYHLQKAITESKKMK